MGDAHVMVVDGVGDKEDRAAVATTDHEILDRLVGDLNSTPNDVVDDSDPIVGSPEAHDDTGPILDVAISRPAVIAALEARFVVLGLDLFLRQVAVVGMARVEQLLHRRHVQL